MAEKTPERKPVIYNEGDKLYQMIEDPTRCIEETTPDSWHFSQCSRKRGFGKDGLYCKQHAKRHPA